MKVRSIMVALVGAFAMFHVAAAEAQQNNRAFSFNGSGGGSGMSFGARQAIVNQQVLGITPNQLVTGPGGVLLNVQRGPGGSAIVSTLGGTVIPSFRGGFRGSGGSINAWTSQLNGLGRF